MQNSFKALYQSGEKYCKSDVELLKIKVERKHPMDYELFLRDFHMHLRKNCYHENSKKIVEK